MKIHVDVEDLEVQLGSRTILEGIRLTLSQGQKVMVKGPSGCGKSTLLKVLLGLVPFRGGRIHVMGKRLCRDTVWDIRRSIGYVAQSPMFGVGSCREVLLSPLYYHANRQIPRDRVQQNLEQWFERLHLERALLNQQVGQLSGGQLQRVGLIAAMLLERPILLLDEITAALDPQNRDAVHAVIHSLDQSVIWVSHDTDSEAFADQVLTLNAPDLQIPSIGA